MNPMDESVLPTSMQSSGNKNTLKSNRINYVIIFILILSLLGSIYLNFNYSGNNKLLTSKVEEIENSLKSKTQEIETLNVNIANLNIEIKRLSEKNNISTESDLATEMLIIKKRDLLRMAQIKEISIATAMYTVNTAILPPIPESGCIPSIIINDTLKTVPTDPIE